MHKSIIAIFRLNGACLLLATLALLLPTPAAAQGSAPAAHTPNAKPDPGNPAQIGRTRLDEALDGIAAKYIARRDAAVARIYTRAQAEARQTLVRRKILALLGSLPARTPLNARMLGSTQADGFRVEKLLFDSQPNFPVTALLYLPDGARNGKKHPAILITPGHYPTSKAIDYSTSALFARNGFVVLSYDPIGQGERLQYPDPTHPGHSLLTHSTGEHGEASLQPMLVGDTFSRYVLWDAMRGVDYLSQLPEVDPRRIGALGCSGGGAMTALLGALDKRVAAIGVACYTTSFDTLLPAMGPQDGEQSIPGFIASGLDFPDWIELAAPRPYAVIATYNDMFPFAGARSTVIEARRFYALFDRASAGTRTRRAAHSIPPTPTGPALNADTTNRVSPTAHLQFITGPGGHGALAPIMDKILGFFVRNLEPGVEPNHLAFAPIDSGRGGLYYQTPADLPKDALQVTPTGQVLTSYPTSATVFTLNKQRAASLIPAHRTMTGAELTAVIREVTGARARPGAFHPGAELLTAKNGPFVLPPSAGAPNAETDLVGELSIPPGAGRHPAVLLVTPGPINAGDPIARANLARFNALAAAGNVVLAITPRPSPPGTDDMKSPLLGPFYLLSLRADLVGRTLIGLRVDDVIRATDYLASRADVDPKQITAVASGHMGLVLLHAAVLEPRLQHITVDRVLASYRSLLAAPLPIGAPEDVLPGVLLHYDIPDLTGFLGKRLTETYPLQGGDDLSLASTPLQTLTQR